MNESPTAQKTRPNTERQCREMATKLSLFASSTTDPVLKKSFQNASISLTLTADLIAVRGGGRHE